MFWFWPGNFVCMYQFFNLFIWYDVDDINSNHDYLLTMWIGTLATLITTIVIIFFLSLLLILSIYQYS